MQASSNYLPMVKDFIIKNMPSGGYNLVSKRLEKKEIKMSNQDILQEVRVLKKDVKLPVIGECLRFMKDNGIELDTHCEEYLSDLTNK